MAGITSSGRPLLATTTKTAPVNFTSLDSKLFRFRFHFSNLSKSDSRISLSHASVVTCAHVNPLRSGQIVSERGNLKKATTFEDMAVVSLPSVKKANDAVEYFYRSYFMFHGLDANSTPSVFQFITPLLFTESYVYQMDNLNENLMNFASDGDALIERGLETQEEKETWTAKQIALFKTDPFEPLSALLESQGLLNERIMEQFKLGHEYWILERNLCSARLQQKEISVDDVLKTMRQKSFDFRIMDLLMYQLRGEKVNDLYTNFLSCSEFLTEIYDDMIDYKDDVIGNNFNILRMFVLIYGSSAAPTMLCKVVAEAQEKYDSSSKALDPQLVHNHERIRDEVLVQLGWNIPAKGQSFGLANIPPVIADEGLFRFNYLKSK